MSKPCETLPCSPYFHNTLLAYLIFHSDCYINLYQLIDFLCHLATQVSLGQSQRSIYTNFLLIEPLIEQIHHRRPSGTRGQLFNIFTVIFTIPGKLSVQRFEFSLLDRFPAKIFAFRMLSGETEAKPFRSIFR